MMTRLTPTEIYENKVAMCFGPALREFQRIAFAASPLEVRILNGRRPGQERFPQVDADATGVP